MNQIVPQMYAKKAVDANTRVRADVGVVVCDENGRVLLERRCDCGWWDCRAEESSRMNLRWKRLSAK